MGVSFKISSSGSRFKPKPAFLSEAVSETLAETSKATSKNESNNSTTYTVTSCRKIDGRDEDSIRFSDSSLSSRPYQCFSDHEVSFTLNLFPDGYSIGKPSEDSGHHSSVHDAPKLLLPYDRASEPLFLAIESGWLPVDILNDIPCKYVDGGLVCQVRDFRKCISDSGSINPSADASPNMTKVHLRMSLENVVKDISTFADDSWTYGDLMEVESRVLKVLQPKLCLDPTPRLDRLCQDPVPSKLTLGLSGFRTKRMREMPDISLTSISRLHGKRISIGRFADSSTYRLGESASCELLPQHMQDSISVQNISPGSSNVMASRSGGVVQDATVSAINLIPQQSKFIQGVGSQRSIQDCLTSTVINTPIASPVTQDMTITYNDTVNSNTLPHGKLEPQDGQMLPYSGKRARLGSVPDNIHPQQLGSYMDSLQASDVQWKNHLLQQQANARGIQFSNTGMPRYSQIGHEGSLSQDGATAVSLGHQGMRYADQIDADIKLDKSDSIRVKNDGRMAEAESNQMDQRFQQRSSQQAIMRPNFPQAGWNNLGQQAEKDPRKEDHSQKRKASQSPRVSSSIVPQSPLSGKSSELAGGLLGIQYGAVSSAIPGPSQREKSAGMSISSVGRSQSGICGANDSMQQQGQLAGKWRSNSLPKTPAMSGVGSPVSISNVCIPMNAASPVSTGTVADQSMLEKFSKIEMTAARFKLNSKRTKTDELSRKHRTFSPQEVGTGLSTIASDENIKDDNSAMPLSKSLVGGSINTLKIRVLSFKIPDRTGPGNTPVATRARARLIMSEKPQDGTVAMHFGDLEDRDYLNAEDYLPSLSTPHFADLLASQFSVLMLREGYYLDDHVQARQPGAPVVPSPNQRTVPSIPSSVNESQQYVEASSAPQMHETKPIINANTAINAPSSNLLASSGMLSAGGNPQALQMSQGLVHGGLLAARTPQMDSQQSVSQQHVLLPNNQQQQMMHQHQAHFSRSGLLPPTSLPNALGVGQNSNQPLGNSQMANKASPLQMLQQPNQQQQSPSQAQIQSQMQRKMMMGLGTGMGMGGSIANNIVGLGGLGNVMGMGGPRGIGGSSPIPGMGNMGQNGGMGINQASNFTNAISQQLRSGTLTHMQAQAILASRMRITQNRGMIGGPQTGMTGGAGGGARQMQPTGLSMLSQTLQRGGNTNPMQQQQQQQQRPSMAAPRLMTGMNVHMNQQQLLQIQQQHMQNQQMQQQQQQQQLPVMDPQPQMQQQEASALQSVISAQQVSSPVGLIQQQQQPSPQMSSGAMNPTSAGNPEPPGPASPQLSSQTLGSVGSINNSPMDLQGVNKKSTV